MFQLSLFVESPDSDKPLRIASEAIRQLKAVISSYDVVSSEPYWKVDGWYKVTCDIQTNDPLNRVQAESLVSRISDKWEWDEVGSSAHSSAKDMAAIFCDDAIKFASCWFEELN
ncbi:hypothetical protein B2M26_03110 [Ferroacidibacillus organovorans]|uniref:Uncharacterized protein n=1 Tax=Ferroacidibacillus organovorans TaxID=1765683 RepID=A0A1V4EW30_9BACL|nr:hypothetical protein B2M26_03110 [Ferroacidibacillus organovorans]